MVIRIPSMSVSQVRLLSTVRQQAALNTGTSPGDQSVTIPLPSPPIEPVEPKIEPTAKLPDIGSTTTAKAPIKQQAPTNSTTQTAAASAKSSAAGEYKAVAGNASARLKLQKSYAEKIQVFVSAPFPAPGSSPTFEIASRHYPPRKALQMIMRRALQDYDSVLEKGRFRGLPQTYATDPAAEGHLVLTSRMMPMELQRIARAHFDPLGLESTRSFGQKLATAALAAFFTHEIKR